MKRISTQEHEENRRDRALGRRLLRGHGHPRGNRLRGHLHGRSDRRDSHITTPTVANFGGVTLNGTAQTTTASVGTFTVTDARGTGVGWNVTVQATQFTMTGHTLPMNSISMPAPTVAKIDSTSGNTPSITTGPYLIDNASAVKITSAAADGTGMGSYTFTPGTLTLSIPANAYAGTYTSTVTVSVVTGP